MSAEKRYPCGCLENETGCYCDGEGTKPNKMKKSEKLKKRLIEVFTNWVEWSDETALKEIKNILNEKLDEWNSEDAFGTEGQNDPRGDQRNIRTKPKI